MHELTLVIIKPDAVKRGLVGEILSRFEKIGLEILSISCDSISSSLWEEHYDEHRGKAFFRGLVQSMARKPAVFVQLQGENAVDRCRTLIGATKPSKAAPGTIRGDYGVRDGPENLVHASDSPESADRELLIWEHYL